MANEIRFFELNTGAKIPSVGLGTWQSDPGLVGDAVAVAVKARLLLGRTFVNETHGHYKTVEELWDGEL